MALEHLENGSKKPPGKSPAAAPRAEGFLPVETFLIAAEPVWVWNSGERAVVWANGAAKRLWGDAGDGKAKFSPSPAAVKRLTGIARRKAGGGQWTVTLPLPGASGDVLANCHVQKLELAGGATGLLIKAQLDAPPPPVPPAPVKKRAPARAAKAVAAAEIAARPRRPAGKSAAADTKAPPKTGPSKTKPDMEQTPPPAPAKKRKFRAKASDMAFLAGLSHDLRNPLGAILGFAELLRTAGERKLSMAKIEEYAADIGKSAELALDLANDLLNWSSHGQAGRPSSAASTDVAATLADCVRLAAPLVRQAGLTMELLTPEVLPPVPVTERGLKQILLNVMLNSVKFTAPGGSVRIKAARNKAGAVVISVEDSGGRDQSVPATLQAGRVAIPGAGIGLTMVRALLKEAGAKLHRRKRPAGGTATRLIFG
jgi:hypothetical protein